jgi:diguanylate cyclase (GGDEF)-like protein
MDIEAYTSAPVYVLHVEDDDADARLINLALTNVAGSPFTLIRRCSADHAINVLKRQHIDVILLDLSLPDSSGMNTLKKIKSHASTTAVVVITGTDDQATGLEAVKNGAQDYLVKDEVNSRTIERAIRYAVERNNYDQRVLELACIDALTGLPNRIQFIEYLTHAIDNASRLNATVSVLFIDCDHFKLINDTFGHATGDEYLALMAETIKSTVRTSDFVARLGGDEFVIAIQTSDRAIHSPLTIAEKLQLALNAGLKSSTGVVMDARCSIGITSFNPHVRNCTPSQLLYEADAAMYTSKRNGGNAINFFDTDLEKKAARRKLLLSFIPNALKRGEFTLHYQAIANGNTGQFVGMEALLRWNRNGEEMVSPAEFIPLLEECGLIQGVGDWIINTAMEDFVHLQRQELIPTDAWVSVNISPAQIHERTFVDRITKAISRTGMDPKNLVLEITETLLVEQNPLTRETINKVCKLGCSWAIDDFGVGFSSMNYLKILPFSRLKIDRSFIMDGCLSDEDRAIVTAMIALGQSLNMQVVAEGVETEDTWRFLTQQQCDFIQGYVYARPCDLAKFKIFLHDGKNSGNNTSQSPSAQLIKPQATIST